jgi:hypothetical protein
MKPAERPEPELEAKGPEEMLQALLQQLELRLLLI